MAEESKKDLLERVAREINSSPEALELLSQAIGRPITHLSSLKEIGLNEDDVDALRTTINRHILTSHAKPGPSGKPN